MSVVKLEAKNKKPALKVEYLGKVYTLPGAISGSMVEQMIATKETAGDEGFLRMFLSDVLPADFKEAISQDDIGPLAKLWMEHVQGPKESSSTD
jgi:hypothetical protein